MRTIDYSPLYRSTVGFDRLFSLLDNMGTPDNNQNAYPPYNIERTGDDSYRITMAVAGFSDADIEIEAKQNMLTIKAEKADIETEEEKNFLFQGIAARSFERRFQLADHVEVKDASLQHGLLHIDLVREIPEAMKARKIVIGTVASKASKAKQIEAKK